jgi:hypothetical protein
LLHTSYSVILAGLYSKDGSTTARECAEATGPGASLFNSLVLGGPEGDSDVMTSTIFILGFKEPVLFDSGATHSFVSSMFVKLSRLSIRSLEVGLEIATYSSRENCSM